MELFVFVRMNAYSSGSLHDRLAIKLLEGVASTNLTAFDAAKSECGLYKDQELLLGVIESAYGDFLVFNKLVRKIISAELQQQQDVHIQIVHEIQPGGWGRHVQRLAGLHTPRHAAAA